jgi:hypothetical protein
MKLGKDEIKRKITEKRGFKLSRYKRYEQGRTAQLVE